MTCRSILDKDGAVVGVACSRGQRCSGCGGRASKQCDFELKGPKAGKTCDKHLCGRCAVNVGPNRDLCPAHSRMRPEEKRLVRERFRVED